MNATDVVGAFAEIAPAMIFLKLSAGQKAWHPLHHYANFTIDDPWLRESYGYLNYRGLLGEMEKHNFHSTIAFIPWNYERNEPEIVELVRQHPNRFSISIHGDNHDHKEFTDDGTKSLSVQIDAIKQSLSRMERFQQLTGISYDKVMVFPHSVAPERTFEQLKTYNFLATVNSSNVPMDRPAPAAIGFSLRPMTLAFGNFPSVKRYNAKEASIPGLLAINDFLDNPLFFYEHHEYFANSIGAFNAVADQVNKLEPDIRWSSLGEIAKHLYLVRQSDDGEQEVLAFSSTLELENPSGSSTAFCVRKEETGRPAVKSVTIEGQPQQYHIQNGILEFSAAVPPHATAKVAIDYANDLQSAPVEAGAGSIRVYFLRMASDFRDIAVAKDPMGRAFIRFYNQHEATPTQVLACGSVLIGLLSYGGWRLKKTVGKSSRVKPIV